MMSSTKCFIAVTITISLLSQTIHTKPHKQQHGKDKVFLLVLDGIAHNYEQISRNLPNFAKLAQGGVRAKRMIPVFPTNTFPNMETLNTGLYAESHGIVNNHVFDASAKRFVSLNNVKESAELYKSEPIWSANQKQGRGSSSVYFWPGYYRINDTPKYHNKDFSVLSNFTQGRQAIDKTLKNLESDDSLNFMVVYINFPDPLGHAFGFKSPQYKSGLETIDRDLLGYTMKRLEKHRDVNLIVVSDHGFNDVKSIDGSYFYDEILEAGSYIAPPGCGASCEFAPTLGHTTDELLQRLLPLEATGKFKVYRLGDECRDIPERFHLRNNKKILPILVIAEPGYAISSRLETEALLAMAGINVEFLRNNPNFPFGFGLHGYDNADRNMSTIFLAKGPAFKECVSMDPLEAVHVAPLIAHLLGVKAKPNNGSLNVFRNALKRFPYGLKYGTFSDRGRGPA